MACVSLTLERARSPVASLLKFRLPWEDGTTQYLAGQVYFSSFGPQTTTETRLVVLKGTKRRRARRV